MASTPTLSTAGFTNRSARPYCYVTLEQASATLPVVEGGSSARPDIRVEVHKGSSTITVNWPLEGAASCNAWLREWLR